MDEFFDEKKESSLLAAAKLTYLLLAFQKGNDLANHIGGKTVPLEDVWSNNVRLAIIRKNLALSAKAIGTMEDDLRWVLFEAHEEGLGVRGLAHKINDLYGRTLGYRSLRIARTELTGSVNDGAFRTFREQGYREKTWSTTMDGHERDSHAHANGQTVPMDEPFMVGGEEAMFPGDPSLSPGSLVNCRCVMQPAGMPEDRRMKVNQMFLRFHGMLELQMVSAVSQEFARQRSRIIAKLFA